jgi:hypothetical protein
MTAFILGAALAGLAADAPAPVTFEFLRMCGPAPGRKDAYDPERQQFHLQVRDIARFRVQAVAPDLDNRPVVLVIVGMLDRPEGPLTLRSGGREYRLAPDEHDRERFKVERREGVTTIEFLPKGKALLRPGAEFQYIDFYRR